MVAASAFFAVAAVVSPTLAQQSRATAFVDVALVSGNSTLQEQTVVVRDGRIVQVGPAASTAAPLGAFVIPGRGRELMPGLVDATASLPAPGPVRVEDVLLSYLARGVTTLRLARASDLDRDLQQRVDGGTVLGPRIVIAPDVDDAAEDVRVGARADLILLDGDLQLTFDPLRIFGFMVGGTWRLRAQIDAEAEKRARGLVVSYATLEFDPPEEDSCVGRTLYDCFGGEQRCAYNVRCNPTALVPVRRVLIDRLALLAEVAPTSDWIIGQWVSALIEDDRLDDARNAADRCRATAWWCYAIQGYARERAAPGAGEAYFDSAYASAPPATLAWVQPGASQFGDNAFADRTLRCEWVDLGYLLTGSLLEQYRERPCGENRDFETQYWWLADPLWSIPGNSRRSEHFARIVQMRLHDDQNDGTQGTHVRGHHTSVMRVGVPNSWRVEMRGRANQAREAFIRYVDGGYSFTPDEERLRDPVASSALDWAVTGGEEPGLERLVTAETWYDLDQQSTVLRRGTRLLLLTAAIAPALFPSLEGVRVSLAAGHIVDRRIQVSSGRMESSGVARAETLLDGAGWVESLEVLGNGWVGRVRQGIAAPEMEDGFGVSSPVLVDERFEAGASLLDSMVPSTDLGARSSIGVYFETYGVRRDEKVTISVSLERAERSFLSRIAGALRLGSESGLDVSWAEAAEPDDAATLARHLNVGLGSLGPGEYRLTVEVTRADRDVRSSSRLIRVGG